MTNLQKIAISYETNILENVANFYFKSLETKSGNLNALISKMRTQANLTIKNLQNALIEQTYETYKQEIGKNITREMFIANKRTADLILKGSEALEEAVAYSFTYATNYANKIINQKQGIALSNLDALFTKGLMASPKYAFEGSVNFIDNENAFESAIEGSIEKNESGLCYIPYTHSACPKCSVWQGKYLIDDVRKGAKPDGEHELLSTAISMGFLHPNCRDTIIYVEDKEKHQEKNKQDKGYERVKRLKDQDTKYEAEQRQRELAKQTRAWKRKQESGLSRFSPSTIDQRIAEKYSEVRSLKDKGDLHRVSYHMFQTKYEYKPRWNWDINSFKNR